MERNIGWVMPACWVAVRGETAAVGKLNVFYNTPKSSRVVRENALPRRVPGGRARPGGDGWLAVA